MREVREIVSLRTDIIRRLSAIGLELDKELCEGLEADWSFVALQFDMIKDQAELASGKAWVIWEEANNA